MRLHEVVQVSRDVASTRARLRKIEGLAACVRRLAPDEVAIAVPMLGGDVRQGKVGVGWAAVRDASPGGAVERPELTLADVDAALDAVQRLTGRGSVAERQRVLASLLGRATGEEQEFLRRLLLGELRQGALEGVMVEAVARAASVDPAVVRRALMLKGDLGAVAAVALAEGATGLARFRLTLLQPIQPMLAQSVAGAAEGLDRLGRAALEYKVDGARVQVHRADDEVRVFTRALNDVTAAVPELVEVVRALPARRIVLDGEAIALRPDGGPATFQTTMRRFGRRLDVERLRAELPLAPFFFDCLHLDGDDLIDRAGAERWEALSSLVAPSLAIPRTTADDAAGVDAFARAALDHGHEGIMLKSLDAPYEAGRRGASWLKLKPAHGLDLVVLAAEWGTGRRRGWLSNLHLGARDPATGGFVMLGKTFKGLTDEMLRWQTERLLGLEVARDATTVYVRPELVVEILFDGVQTSPHYPGGLALRFARVKAHRPEKAAAETDDVAAVRAIHARAGGQG